jgi:hypothetical protein
MCLLLLLLLATSISQVAHAREAVKSRFNSQGKINVSMSSLENLDGLKHTLRSCSYEKELVIISSSTSFVDAAAQTIHMLQRYGIHQ